MPTLARGWDELDAIDVAAGTEWCELLCLLPGYDPFDQGAGYYFDIVAAQNAIEFIETCIHHAKGTTNTPAGAPFILSPWQKAIVANLFGWKCPNGTRRYRECFIYVAKKNGKTAFAAALLLMVMVTDGEVGGEFYSAAASRDQAGLLFAHAMGMVKAESELSARLTIYGAKGGSQQKSIVYEAESSSYRCLSADADTVDGVSPHLNIIDELHRHKDGELSEVLVKSTAARAQPLTIYTTTADYNRPSFCNVMLKRARQVRDNKGDPLQPGHDPQFLPVVYEAAQEDQDNFRDPAVWVKANPNYGITVTHEFLDRESKKAEEVPTELNNFLRLHLNIVTDAAEAWMSMVRWQTCSGLLTEGLGLPPTGETPQQWRKRMLLELIGRPCFLGMDLSSKIDLTAIVQIFRPRPEVEEPWIFIPWVWVPATTAHEKEKKDKVPYSVWEREGFVELTNGDEIDSQAIRAKINAIDAVYPIREIGYDNWNGVELARQLKEDDGYGEEKMWVVRQGSISLSEPMKEMEAMVVGKRMAHGNNPVFNWCVANLTAKKDVNGNLQPDKAKSVNKIDVAVAAFTGMARALAADPDEPEEEELDARWI